MDTNTHNIIQTMDALKKTKRLSDAYRLAGVFVCPADVNPVREPEKVRVATVEDWQRANGWFDHEGRRVDVLVDEAA